MNLLEILATRVEDLPDGDYIQGLKSVIQHIAVANRHLQRGQENADDTAFTDAIYRTNQAFEGSLKEAYRVLTNQNPSVETPFNIEKYLRDQNILRPRVLSQLTNYRREWRNPSTHDYLLDFDEDEALLAIVTVSAFAVVLIDQITERISFEHAKSSAAEHLTSPPITHSFIEKISALIEQFIVQFNQTHEGKKEVREIEIVGALAGYLNATVPDISVQVEKLLSSKTKLRADIVLTSNEENIIVEIKRGRRLSSQLIKEAILQVSSYMKISNIKQAIILIYNNPNNNKVVYMEQPVLTSGNRIIVISVE